jgi:hypothetical protein
MTMCEVRGFGVTAPEHPPTLTRRAVQD